MRVGTSIKLEESLEMTAGQTFSSRAENLPNTTPSDLNFTAPLQIFENQPAETIIGHFIAHDPNVPTNLTFTLVGGSNDNDFFNLEANGTLRTSTVFDYEAP